MGSLTCQIGFCVVLQPLLRFLDPERMGPGHFCFVSSITISAETLWYDMKVFSSITISAENPSCSRASHSVLGLLVFCVIRYPVPYKPAENKLNDFDKIWLWDNMILIWYSVSGIIFCAVINVFEFVLFTSITISAVNLLIQISGKEIKYIKWFWWDMNLR